MDFNETKFPRPSETDIRNISGLIPASAAAPTGTPRNFFQQFRIVSGVLYFYDTILNAWHSATAVATPAGSDRQVQYNDNGDLGASANFTFSGTGITVGDLTAHGSFAGGIAIEGKIKSGGTDVYIKAGIDSGGTLGGSVILDPAIAGAGVEGSVIARSNNTSNTRTGGFFAIPECAGAPSGTPHYSSFVSLVYDTTNNKLWAYNGAWRSVTFT